MLNSQQADKSDIVNMTAQNSAILLPTSFAVSVAMPATWPETAPIASVGPTGGTMLQEVPLDGPLEELEEVMLLIVNMRHVHSPS